MKKSKAILSGLILTVSCVGCADLGFGVDVDSGGMSPYWYGNGYMGDTYWNTPVWDYGPIYNPIPPRPPLVGNGPGSVISPPAGKPVPVRPAQKPRPPEVNLGPNGIGWNPADDTHHRERYPAPRQRRPTESHDRAFGTADTTISQTKSLWSTRASA